MFVNLYIPSEYEELKRIPGGGLTLIRGEPESYYYLVGRYILFNHCMNGGRTLYIALDENIEDIRESMATLGMNINVFEANRQWVFMDLYSKRIESFTEKELLKYVQNGFWTALDSLSTFLLEFIQVENTISFIKHLSSIFRLSNGLHIAYVIPSLHDVRINVLLKQAADIVMDCSYSEEGGTISRLLKIIKIKRRPFHGIMIPFIITSYGISFEITTRLA
ncbi:MAG: ATPase domain-containing protein [Candidatus Methanomethylicia archaeon]